MLFQFSIAAINHTESKGNWEPPTKEAQEFRLSQTYHEGLHNHKLQVKEYRKAAELLESVLEDPLIENAQVDGSVSDCHLLQLRFGFRHHPIICAILGLGVQFSNPHRRNQSLVEF
ncbi:calcineurin-binding protein 1-like [Malus domestica]|uniref:calcineurin-binding protein 1-like n=1 Tax=Malus domestica TaxID=3750 RepID=UPI0039756862